MRITARTIAIAVIVLTAAAIGAVMCYTVFSSRKPHVELNRAIYPIRGIDVSAHNGRIDFDSVAADGIDFVYIKVSEGATWQDSCFVRNYDAARRASLAVGAYHFFRFDVSGWRQGVNLISTLGGRPLQLPVAIDVEEWSNPPGVPTRQITDELRDMIDMIRRTGRPVVIYTNKSGYHRFIRSRFDDVDLWICSFTDPPITDRSRWTLWQHSHIGHVSGVRGPVDLITFNTPNLGDFTEWSGMHH